MERERGKEREMKRERGGKRCKERDINKVSEPERGRTYDYSNK